MSSAESPIRFPNLDAPNEMAKRGYFLLVLNLVLPGSAQLLAGNRKLGRFGLRVTVLVWALVAAVSVGLFINRAATISLLTAEWMLWLGGILAVGLGGLWLVLTLDTVRLVRPVRARGVHRMVLAAGGLAMASVIVAGSAWAVGTVASTNSLLGAVFVAGPAEAPIDGRYNFLLLGGDAGPDRDGLRPDTTMVVSVDANTGRAVTISLPRDLHNITFPTGSVMAGLYPNGYTARTAKYCSLWACLNTVYVDAELDHASAFSQAKAKGIPPGPAAMMEAASGITGLTIQYYALIDMQGFADLVDALGGVTVSVDKPVPIHTDETFTTVREWIQPGTQHLDGYHALWYARSRHGSSDYDRMQRQEKLQAAIVAEFQPAAVLTKWQQIAAAGKQVISTSVPRSMIGYFVDLAQKTRGQPVKAVPMIPDNGIDPANPDYAYLRGLVRAALAPPTASPTPSGR